MNGITHDAIARMLPTESNRKNTLDITLKREAGSVRIPTRQVQKLPLSTGIASIAFVLPGAPPKRAALCAERGSTPITPARKERIK